MRHNSAAPQLATTLASLYLPWRQHYWRTSKHMQKGVHVLRKGRVYDFMIYFGYGLSRLVIFSSWLIGHYADMCFWAAAQLFSDSAAAHAVLRNCYGFIYVFADWCFVILWLKLSHVIGVKYLVWLLMIFIVFTLLMRRASDFLY
jgi:hypothetical protein